MRISNNRGVVLLMVLAVLVLLCIIGFIFVAMANLERHIARSYLDMVRAKFLAQSGVHAAVSQAKTLLSHQEGFTYGYKYYGEDLDGDALDGAGHPDLTKRGVISSVWEDQDGNGVLEIENCPVAHAVRPSFMLDRNNDGILDEQDLIQIQTQGRYGGYQAIEKVGVTGLVAGAYDNHQGDYFAVKMEDLSGRIYVNMEDHEHLEDMLAVLTDELFADGGKIGREIYKHRPYFVMDEIRSKLALNKIQLLPEDWEKLRSCLTVYAWCDKGVIKPACRYDKGAMKPIDRIGNVGINSTIYSWEQIRPTHIRYPQRDLGEGEYELVGRAPVNINLAPKPVLVTLLTNLNGLFLWEQAGARAYSSCCDFPGIQYSYTGTSGCLGQWVLAFYPMAYYYGKGLYRKKPLDWAQRIADAIIKNRELPPDPTGPYPWRGEFRSWQQFNSFCDNVLWRNLDPELALPCLGRSVGTEFLGRPWQRGAQQADVIKANFNPNANISAFNPPSQRLYWVDKLNLTYYTTEFTFLPTGYFLITSLGRVLGPQDQDKIMAEAQIEATVRLFAMYKETSQRQFLREYWEKGVPLKDNIITSAKHPTDDTDQTITDNLTLQTYPEILGRTYGGESFVEHAHYDGYIALATVENEPSGYVPKSTVKASYNKTIATDPAILQPQQMIESGAKGPYVNTLVCPSDNFGAVNAWKDQPGKLFPDGVYSEYGDKGGQVVTAVPIYQYQPSHWDYFTISMWVKPHFFPEESAKTRPYLTWQIPLPSGGIWLPPGGGEVLSAPLGIYSIANGITSTGTGIIDKESFSAGGYNKGLWSIYNQPWDDTSLLAGGCTASGSGYEMGSRGEASASVSCALNHRYCNHDRYERNGHEWGETVFQAGKWMHLGWTRWSEGGECPDCPGPPECTWPCPGCGICRGCPGCPPHTAGPVGGTYVINMLYINGRRLGENLYDTYFQTVGSAVPNVDFGVDENNILRLGERKESPSVLNSAPDATMDELLIWEKLHPDKAEEVIQDKIWRDGRYYRGNKGTFTSRPINLAEEAGLPPDTSVDVLYVTWTQYVPEEKWVTGVGGYPESTPLPRPGEPKAPTCEIELYNEEKVVIKLDQPLTNPAGSLVKKAYTAGTEGKLIVDKPIRYHVLFKPNVDVLNDVLIDSLIFDDITIIYYLPTRFLSWAYRRGN